MEKIRFPSPNCLFGDRLCGSVLNLLWGLTLTQDYSSIEELEKGMKTLVLSPNTINLDSPSNYNTFLIILYHLDRPLLVQQILSLSQSLSYPPLMIAKLSELLVKNTPPNQLILSLLPSFTITEKAEKTLSFVLKNINQGLSFYQLHDNLTKEKLDIYAELALVLFNLIQTPEHPELCLKRGQLIENLKTSTLPCLLYFLGLYHGWSNLPLAWKLTIKKQSFYPIFLPLIEQFFAVWSGIYSPQTHPLSLDSPINLAGMIQSRSTSI